MISKSETRVEDIKLLRQLSRTPSYCQAVQESELDSILAILFDKVTDLSQKLDVIASVSNIVLINRSLHLNHFIPKYSKRLFAYTDEVIKEVGHITEDKEYQELIPVYRILFLTLYGGLEEISHDIIEDVLKNLIQGFHDCVQIIDRKLSDVYYRLLLVEILKCLYTLQHKYEEANESIQKETYNDDCIIILNRCYGKVGGDADYNLLIKNTLAFLLVFYSGNTNDSFGQHINTDLYMDFINKGTAQLCESLIAVRSMIISSEIEESNTFNLNLLFVLSHMSKSFVYNIKTKSENHEACKKLLNCLVENILPTESKNAFYNEVINLVVTPLFSRLTHSPGLSGLQQKTQTNGLFLELYYNASYDSDHQLHILRFVRLFGSSNTEAFFKKHDIDVSGIDLSPYKEPSCKFLDEKRYKNTKLEDTVPESSPEPVAELTQEEKEKEAEKLFVIFERMEKLGTFENFENPVKKWQREGKFEELDNEEPER